MVARANIYYKWNIDEQELDSCAFKESSTQRLDKGWPQFLGGGQKTCFKKLGGHKNVSKNAWRAKFNLIKTHSGAKLTFNIPSSTLLTSHHIKCNSRSCNCVIFYKALPNSQNCFTNLIFKKGQRAHENVLAGSFLPPGSGLATPDLTGRLNRCWTVGP